MRGGDILDSDGEPEVLFIRYIIEPTAAKPIHVIIIIIINVTRMQSAKDHTLLAALRQCWTGPSCGHYICLAYTVYMYGSFIYFKM